MSARDEHDSRMWPHVDINVYSVVIVPPAHHGNQLTEIDLILGSSAVNCFAFCLLFFFVVRAPTVSRAFQRVSMKNGIHLFSAVVNV